MSFISEYSSNWHNLGSLLLYISNDFQYKSSVIITEFEGTLIDRVSSTKLYNSMDPKDVTIHDELFIKKIYNDSKEHSIVVISNSKNGNIHIDLLKKKFESFMNKHKFPIMALFSLLPNKFCKPHTSSWKFLELYYKKIGNSCIHKSIVVSNNGGQTIEKIRCSVTMPDIDRAFANNIGSVFYTVDEYMKPELKEKYLWNKNTISPENRIKYLDILDQYHNPNIMEEYLTEDKLYIVIIYGAPRSGKSSLAKCIKNEWKKHPSKITSVLDIINTDHGPKKRIKLCEKKIADRISVIIDGNVHNNELRKPYQELAKKYNAKLINIEVNPGLGMAYLLNHIAVEESNKEDIFLYDDKYYKTYKGTVERTNDTIFYAPVIRRNDILMNYRF